MNKTCAYCTFMLDGYWYGVPVNRVQEVLRHSEMTRVPLAPHAVSGLINLRGQIVTVIDLRRRLHLSDRDPSLSGTHVIVSREGEVVSLLVDALGDVRNVESDQFESPPETLHGVGRELVAGMYKTAQDLLVVLEVDKIADVDASAGAA